jgi:hypothetical protein
MPRIDLLIIVHEIKTYLGAKPVRQKRRPVHPKKIAAIKLSTPMSPELQIVIAFCK